MKTKDRLISPALALAVGSLFCVPAFAQQPAQTAPKEYHTSELVTETATVQSVDLNTRELTIKGEIGSPLTLTVDPRVKRLDEIKPGDTITAVYYVSMASDFHAPTEEEKANPIVLVAENMKSYNEAQPAGGGMRTFKVVATIEGLNRASSTMSIKGPRGNVHTVKVKQPDKLADLQIGQQIVVTYTEAVAIGVEKPKTAEKKE